jgi:hypothetical protein
LEKENVTILPEAKRKRYIAAKLEEKRLIKKFSF